ncbi:MAG: threonine synthase [Anaerolineae bacterium]|jgi:threonine synthase
MNLDHVLGLECTICGAVYGVNEVDYVCPGHGDDGILDVLYDYDLVSQRIDPDRLRDNPMQSIWRYMPLLPVDPETAEQLARGTSLSTVGWTPMYPAPRIAGDLGLDHLWVKDDSRQPTASLKDRASAVAVVKTHEQHYDVVTTASTGNAAAALSGLCAAVGQPNVIFVPRSAPEAKIAQLLAYGSTVLLVDGSYDEAFELCLEVARRFDWYNRNTGYNPYMSEGKKTVIYEVCEQLGLATRPSQGWQTPDAVFVPVGDGCIIGGVHKGLRDLLALGWIDRMPRIVGVQAEGSSPLVDAWQRGLSPLEMEPVEAHSVADSIVAGLPRDRIKALRAARETGGAYVSVSDREILDAIPSLAQGCGVFAEPAAAAALAGLTKAVNRGMIGCGDRVVILSTGSGLKDVASVLDAIEKQPPVVEPTLAAAERVLGHDAQLFDIRL